MCSSMKKHILITGGTGFIGSHAVIAFEQAGYSTVVVDNLCNSSTDVLEGIKKILWYKPDFYEGDLRDTAFLAWVFWQYSFDGVIHFAALKAVGESCEKPLEYMDNNVGGTIQLAKTMQQFGVQKIIFSSSCTVYGSQTPPIVETMSIGNTSNPYGSSKVLCEYILKDMAEFGGMQVISLRYFNPIGAHPSGYIGEKVSWRPNNIFPYILKVLAWELSELQVFGNDYNTPDGTGVRDYIDIVDLVWWHIAAYRHLEKQKPGFWDAYNLGTGKGVSVLELIQAVESVSSKKVPYAITSRRPWDIDAVWANCDKAKSILGWEATTSIDESIHNALLFVQQNQ